LCGPRSEHNERRATDGRLTSIACLVSLYMFPTRSFILCMLVSSVSSAHYMYPIRVRFPNIRTGLTQWMTVGYMPFIKPGHAPTRADRRKLRMQRDELLQRCLAVLCDRLITASKDGFLVRLQQQSDEVLAVPRVVLYAADHPEERHVLGLKLNGCLFPCSQCLVNKTEQSCPGAVCTERPVLYTLEMQMEAALLYDRGCSGGRLNQIAATTCALPFVPVLGAFHGLGTGTLGLYKVFGFDLLHVRSNCSCLSGE